MFKHYYRRPRTTQERRANGSRKDHEAAKWRRAKRSASNIVNAWDDVPAHEDKKCWKSKRRSQYHFGGRGEQHSVYFAEKEWLNYWRFIEYLDSQEIPYNVEEDNEVEIRVSYLYTKSVPDGQFPVYCTKNGIRRILFWYTRYTDVKLETPIRREHRHVTTKGYKVTFWTHKNLDLTFWTFGVS